MNNREITKLALKIFSIYILVQALLLIPQFYPTYIILSNGSEYHSSFWFVLIAISSILLLIVLSIFIWRLSNTVYKKITKPTNQEMICIKEPFAVSIFGLYLIFYGLTKLAFLAIGFYYSTAGDNITSLNLTQNILYIVMYFIVTLIGVSLVIKSDGWAALLNKARFTGSR